MALASSLIVDDFPNWMVSIVGFLFGLALGAIFCYLATQHASRIFNSKMQVILGVASAMNLAVIVVPLRDQLPYFDQLELFIFITVSSALIVFLWVRLCRAVYELWVESWARPMYKIRSRGPGVTDLPLTGPLVIIANHACWWDPLFIAGVVPRPITPLMTSNFYDLKLLNPIMKHVVHAIRVPEIPLRREAPEILEAIAALDRGECVVIFPEGYLRRKDDVPLRRFGRGTFELLKARPATPVIACWIEGAWGSWCSWKGGPPMKRKRVDFRRRIDVGMSAPFTVPAPILENHWQTRVFLMNAVSAARVDLGLEPLPEFTVPKKEDTNAEDAEKITEI